MRAEATGRSPPVSPLRGGRGRSARPASTCLRVRWRAKGKRKTSNCVRRHGGQGGPPAPAAARCGSAQLPCGTGQSRGRRRAQACHVVRSLAPAVCCARCRKLCRRCARRACVCPTSTAAAAQNRGATPPCVACAAVAVGTPAWVLCPWRGTPACRCGQRVSGCTQSTLGPTFSLARADGAGLSHQTLRHAVRRRTCVAFFAGCLSRQRGRWREGCLALRVVCFIRVYEGPRTSEM